MRQRPDAREKSEHDKMRHRSNPSVTWINSVRLSMNTSRELYLSNLEKEKSDLVAEASLPRTVAGQTAYMRLLGRNTVVPRQKTDDA